MTDDLLALVGAEFREDVARCAAAAGYRPDFGDPRDCRRLWRTAGAVVLDPTAVDLVAGTSLSRRAGVVLVSADEPPPVTWRRALDLGAGDAITLPDEEDRLVRALGELRSPRRRSVGTVAVLGAHGGAGASVLAIAVALIAARGQTQTLLVDLDELGPGADLLLGAEQVPGLRWQDLALDGGAVSGAALHHALPTVGEKLSVVSSRREQQLDLRADTVSAVIDAGRANGDLVVVDLPRASSGVVHAALAAADLVVLVSTATVPGCAAARRTVDRLLDHDVRVELCVRGPSPGGLRAGQLAEAVGVPLLTAYRPDPRLPARLEAGRPRIGARTPLGRAAHAILRRVHAQERMAA
ncbi:hypothetical protein QSJ18_12290 [Gordonia sp. ABSL1-1]|uniref:septum site-determining protein Ssd n=1 Tax=Gordonia sp. ABSL1-1 TaxID=3053923 RepID=UPI002573F153|nr:septum site-determining protein Ssd [Gordonia sp. ABSL1-1]MDL9937527.1 hypothetical protein [Gordonia sp. ABSL1-1]